jgi:Putative MetA-pathway of phenol degradation
MQGIKKILVLSALLTLNSVATNAFADGFSASVGGDYSTGDYGSSDSTKVFYMPFSARYETGAFTYNLTIPWLRVSGPGDVVPGGFSGAGGASTVGAVVCINKGRGNCTNGGGTIVSGGGGGGGITTTRSTESGIGDIVAAATYNAIDGGENGFVVDFTGRIKLPTASESKGLGSGKTDFAVQVNVDKNFGNPYVSAGLGYKILGEPSGVSYDNVIYGSLGGGYKFSKSTEMGVSYDWATAAVDGATRPQEVSIYGSHYLSDNYKLSGVLYTGLSDASPDVGGGLTLSYYF